MVRIATIVEGHGEVKAAPILLRRIAAAVFPGEAVSIPTPIRAPRRKIVKQDELEKFVKLAAGKAGADGRILILLDADDDCPALLAPELLQRARAVSAGRPVRVILAKAEYEAWFLAAAISIAGRRGIRKDAAPPSDPESIRGAKEQLRKLMPPGRRYRETIDQPALTEVFDLAAAQAAPSFDKLWRDVKSLLLLGRR